MRRLHVWTILVSALMLVALGQAHAQNGTRAGAFSIVEAGLATDGVTPRYSVEATSAELRDLLAALLRKTGKEYVIDQDVTGPVSLVLRDKTLDDILQQLSQIARPPIVIRKGDIITVQVAPASEAGGSTTGEPGVAPGGQRGRVAAVQTQFAPVVPSQTLTLGQPVTLAIPDEKPMALRAVLLQIERQTRVPMRLDPRVPADVAVSARFTDTPLSLVLDAMARTGALKWQVQRDGAVLIAPSDSFVLVLRGVPTFSSQSGACPSCGRPVLPTWRFCPYDGAPLGRTGQSGRSIRQRP